MGRITRLILAGLALPGLLACGAGGGGDDTGGPTLIGSDPVEDEMGVSPDTVVDLFWEQDLDPTTVTESVVELRAPSGPVPGTVAYEATARRIRFVPDEDLSLGTQYTAHVSPGLADVDGGVLEAPYDLSFGIREGGLLPAQLLETEAVDGASLRAFPLNENGRGFVIWIQRLASGASTLWATPYDTATGPGVPTALETASNFVVHEASVDVNAAGDAIVSWGNAAFHRVWARVYDAGTNTWTPTVQLNTTPGEIADFPQARLDAQGGALATWSQSAGFFAPRDLWTRHYSVSGGWGPAVLLENVEGNVRGGSLDMLPSGRACVVWSQETSTVYNLFARRFDPAGGWSAVEALEADDTTRAFPPRVAMAPNGDILAYWHQEEAEFFSDERMWANHFVVGSGWEGEFLLQDDEGSINAYRLAMDGSGNAIVAWVQDAGGRDSVYARRHLATGAWESVVTVSGTDTDTIDSNSLDLVMNPAGQAVATWSQGPSRAEKDIFARRYEPGTGWGGIDVLDPAELGNLPYPRAALDHEGAAIVVWKQGVYDDDDAFLRYDAWSNVYAPAVGWRGAALLEDDQMGSTSTPAVRMDRFGLGVVVWSQTRGETDPESDLYYRAFR